MYKKRPNVKGTQGQWDWIDQRIIRPRQTERGQKHCEHNDASPVNKQLQSKWAAKCHFPCTSHSSHSPSASKNTFLSVMKKRHMIRADSCSSWIHLGIWHTDTRTLDPQQLNRTPPERNQVDLWRLLIPGPESPILTPAFIIIKSTECTVYSVAVLLLLLFFSVNDFMKCLFGRGIPPLLLFLMVFSIFFPVKGFSGGVPYPSQGSNDRGSCMLYRLQRPLRQIEICDIRLYK